MVTVAGDSAGTLNTAGIYVRLKDLGERDRDQFAIMDEVRREVLPPLAKSACARRCRPRASPAAAAAAAARRRAT